jgi:hypothetical protein
VYSVPERKYSNLARTAEGKFGCEKKKSDENERKAGQLEQGTILSDRTIREISSYVVMVLRPGQFEDLGHLVGGESHGSFVDGLDILRKDNQVVRHLLDLNRVKLG